MDIKYGRYVISYFPVMIEYVWDILFYLII